MLKKSNRVSFGWAGVLLGVGVALATACGDTGNTGGNCAPNEQQACKCTGGGDGFQTCNAEGSAYSECDCSGTAGSAGSIGVSGSAGSGTNPEGACGDGIEQAGECKMGGEFYCAEDCPGGGGSGGSTTSDPCEGAVTYAGHVEGVKSNWGGHPQANGKSGFEAGIEICKTIGADHPCDYEEVLLAEKNGELVAKMVPQGTTAWIHRTTDAMVNGNMSTAGPGGRCNDWTYATNHISDGEFVTFQEVGIPMYTLDNDTFYDGTDTTHVVPEMQCGGMERAILCCFPACK
jgi:hypothetical protein